MSTHVKRLIIKSVSVIYSRDNKEVYVSNPTDFPDVNDSTLRVKEVQEPIVKASIIVPEGMHMVLALHGLQSLCINFSRVFRRNDGPLLFSTRRGSRPQIPRLRDRIFLAHHAYMYTTSKWSCDRLLQSIKESEFWFR